MFQYFYLISLLLCIKTVFSYEYLDDVPGRPFHSFGNNVRKVNTSGKRKDRRHSIRHDYYGYDRNPVEFDVADFIRSDEESVADDGAARHRNYRRRRISKNNNDFNSLLGLNVDEGNSRDVNQDYLGRGDSSAKLSPSLMDLAPPILKDSLNIKHLKMNAAEAANAKYGNENYKNLYKNQIILPEQSLTHNPQKKCVFKSIKFPFFSHNKTESLQPKKNKKRRLFGFNSARKSASETVSSKGKMNTNPINQYKAKRSYQVNFCPACRKKYIYYMKPYNRYKKAVENIIHNSRQFYMKHPGVTAKKDINRNTKYYTDISTKVSETDRRKREEADKLDKERQLKLLEDIQRKVDSVKVIVPKFNRVETVNSFV